MGDPQNRYQQFSLHPAVRLCLAIIAAIVVAPVPVVALLASGGLSIWLPLWPILSLYAAVPVAMLGLPTALFVLSKSTPTLLASIVYGTILSSIPAMGFFLLAGHDKTVAPLALLIVLGGALASAAAYAVWSWSGLFNRVGAGS